jgi:hypothetical protein
MVRCGLAPGESVAMFAFAPGRFRQRPRDENVGSPPLSLPDYRLISTESATRPFAKNPQAQRMAANLSCSRNISFAPRTRRFRPHLQLLPTVNQLPEANELKMLHTHGKTGRDVHGAASLRNHTRHGAVDCQGDWLAVKGIVRATQRPKNDIDIFDGNDIATKNANLARSTFFASAARQKLWRRWDNKDTLWGFNGADADFPIGIGNGAIDSNDYFISNKVDDKLWFDTDGNRSVSAPVLITDFTNVFALKAFDFLIGQGPQPQLQPNPQISNDLSLAWRFGAGLLHTTLA